MVYAIVPAAGHGERFGGTHKKQFLKLADKPVFIHTLLTFQNSPGIDEIICVVPKEDLQETNTLIADYALPKLQNVIAGGASRQDSVAAAMALLKKKGQDEDIVLVHDGVRPLVTTELIAKVIEGVLTFGAVAAARPVTDSLKEVTDGAVIQKSLARERIWAMQTPQGFYLSVLAEACEKGKTDHFFATDEAMLVERLGIPILCIEGPSENIKITTAADLKMAQFLLQNSDTTEKIASLENTSTLH